MPIGHRSVVPRLRRFLWFLCCLFLIVFLFERVPLRLSRSRIDQSGFLSQQDIRYDNHLVTGKMSSAQNLSDELNQKKKSFLGRFNKSPSDNDSNVVLIMGNEAGDTDSFASAILLSHLLSTSDRFRDRFPKETQFVPLMQIYRKDLALRAENEYLLDLFHIDQHDLLFLDDLPGLQDMERNGISLGLTDHPSLSGYWQPSSVFAEKVQVLVDHHADAGSHKSAALRVLMGPENGAVGSACSVVVDLFQGDQSLKNLSTALVDFALAAILIDTDDLRPTPRGKATQTDLQAAKTLLEKSSFSAQDQEQSNNVIVQLDSLKSTGDAEGVEEDVKIQSNTAVGSVSVDIRKSASQYYQVLSAKKLDVSHLDSLSLLRRDYKESEVEIGTQAKLRAGFSSVPVGLSEWVRSRHGQKDDRWDKYWHSLHEWMKERNLHVAVVGTSFREKPEDAPWSEEEERSSKDGKHRRELVFAYLEQTRQTVPRISFSSLVPLLESDDYASSLGEKQDQRLTLDAPWKGTYRIPSTGKRERVGGLDKSHRWVALHSPDEELRIAVWRQRNARASRKVYLPAVVHAIKKASKGRSTREQRTVL